MKFGEKLFKWVSYGFMLFIVALIVLTFGMPEFIGSAADSEKHLAAKVGKEVITKKEVQNMKNYMLKMPQFQGFASQESFLEKYALDYLISEKLQVILQKESGIYPLNDAKNSIIAQYLKDNFKEFQTNEGFDFERFDKDFLKPRRINFSAIEDQALRSRVYEFKQLLDTFEPVSPYQIEDFYTLKNTVISYEILAFSADQKKVILKNRIGITEADIQEKFKKDYLSKNKNDKLTDLKREAITQTIINDKKAKYEKDWVESLKNDIGNMNLSGIAQKHGGSYLNIPDVAISDSISQKNPNKKINLGVLENSPELQGSIKTANIGKIQGPWTLEENLFLVNIKSILKPEKSFAAATPEIEDELRNENKNSADQLLDSILREKIKIIRYSYSD